LRGFGAHFPPKNVTHRSNPKQDRPSAEPRYLSHKAWISAARFVLGVGTRKKDRIRRTEKSQKGYISPIWGEAPTQAIYNKNCVVGDLLNIITCAKFQNEIFRDHHFTGGRIFLFFIDIWMGLTTMQRYCAAYETVKCVAIFPER